MLGGGASATRGTTAETASPRRQGTPEQEKQRLETDSFEAPKHQETREQKKQRLERDSFDGLVYGLASAGVMAVLFFIGVWRAVSAVPAPTLGNAPRDDAPTEASPPPNVSLPSCDPISVGKQCVLHASKNNPADYLNHNGWTVTVRFLPGQVSGLSMYYVEASDGWGGAVSETELSAVP